MEIVNFLQDAYQHLLVSRQRKSLRVPGQGYDYRSELETGRQLVASLHPKRMQLQLVEIIPETPSTKTLRFERKDAPLPPFRAGQYLNVFVDVDSVLTSRPYSISSAPGAATLDLTVKRKPGGFVSPYLLNELQVGDVLQSTGPKGKFYIEELIDGDQLVFLAGGSGVTPFMSIIQDTLSRSTIKPIKMHLIYGSRLPEDIIFAQKLTELSGKHPNFSLTQVISEPPVGYQGHAGLLDANLIQSVLTDPSNGILPDLNQNKYYICGPNVMYAFCLNALQELGIPPHRIKRELYGPPDDVTQELGWPKEIDVNHIFQVELAGGKVIQAPAGEPLMNSLERYRVVIPAVCRSGSCSACRVQLVSGKVFHPASARLRQADHQHGFIHACVAYPLEDLTIRI